MSELFYNTVGNCVKAATLVVCSDLILQIGSYFGSVLQTVDVDGDSYTDLLLVGAPMYMGSERDEQGQVYVYRAEVRHRYVLLNTVICVV